MKTEDQVSWALYEKVRCMRMHQILVIDHSLAAVRVPGGLLYRQFDQGEVDAVAVALAFVPCSFVDTDEDLRGYIENENRKEYGGE